MDMEPYSAQARYQNKRRLLLQSHYRLTYKVQKFVQTYKEKLTMSTKEDNSGKESNESDYDEDKDAAGRKARRGKRGIRSRNNKSDFLNL